MIWLHVKKNKTKLSKNCHPHNTRIGSGYISYEIQFEWWDEQNRCTYDDNLKTTGAWFSLYMLQQVTEEVQPRVAAQVNSAVSLDRTRLVNITFSHNFFCSRYMTKHISHTCGTVEEVAGPRDIYQAVLTAKFPSSVLQQLFECLPQSLPDITY